MEKPDQGCMSEDAMKCAKNCEQCAPCIAMANMDRGDTTEPDGTDKSGWDATRSGADSRDGSATADMTAAEEMMKLCTGEACGWCGQTCGNWGGAFIVY